MYGELFKNKKAAVFDLDGTLADTHHLWDQSIINVLKSLGVFMPNIKNIPRGVYISEKWEAVLRLNEVESPFTLSELVTHNYNEYLKLLQQSGLEVKDGFWAFSAELKIDKKFKTGMVTNTVKQVGEQALKMLDLTNVFDVEVYADEISKPKPDPEIYKVAAKKLELKPRDILVFEDSVVGAQASVSAGMDTVVIWDGQILRKEYPREVRGFVTDFTVFPGNMDSTYMERFKAYVQELQQRKP